jgi:hypothetical protein
MHMARSHTRVRTHFERHPYFVFSGGLLGERIHQHEELVGELIHAAYSNTRTQLNDEDRRHDGRPADYA